MLLLPQEAVDLPLFVDSSIVYTDIISQSTMLLNTEKIYLLAERTANTYRVEKRPEEERWQLPT